MAIYLAGMTSKGSGRRLDFGAPGDLSLEGRPRQGELLFKAFEQPGGRNEVPGLAGHLELGADLEDARGAHVARAALEGVGDAGKLREEVGFSLILEGAEGLEHGGVERGRRVGGVPTSGSPFSTGRPIITRRPRPSTLSSS